MKTFSQIAVVLIAMTGIAAAQPKAETKPAPGTGAGSQAAAMPDMKPPQEIADTQKAHGGTWNCKGTGMDHTNKMVDTVGTLKIKTEVGGWWLHSSFDSKMGKEPFQFDAYSTFDATTKKWKRLMVESGGGWSTGEADVAKDKTDWTMTSHLPGAAAAMMGGKTEFQFRDHQDMTDPKAGMKLWGEFTPDGKTWIKVYEVTCKK